VNKRQTRGCHTKYDRAFVTFSRPLQLMRRVPLRTLAGYFCLSLARDTCNSLRIQLPLDFYKIRMLGFKHDQQQGDELVEDSEPEREEERRRIKETRKKMKKTINPSFISFGPAQHGPVLSSASYNPPSSTSIEPTTGIYSRKVNIASLAHSSVRYYIRLGYKFAVCYHKYQTDAGGIRGRYLPLLVECNRSHRSVICHL
jgi:hypothetical protein